MEGNIKIAIATVLAFCCFALPISAAKDQGSKVSPGFSYIQTPFLTAKTLFAQGQLHKAVKSLFDLDDDHLTSIDQSLKYFALGVWAKELQRYDEAITFFQRSKESDDDLLVYNNYQLALTYRSKYELSKSYSYFEKVRKAKPPRNIYLKTRFEMSDILMEQGKWNSAYGHLKYLNRRWYGSEKHPEVLWRLIQVELKRKRKWRACNWARRIYSRYPTHPLIYDWQVDLQENKMFGKKLGCLASEKDMANRFRRMQWGGESKRVRQELALLKSRAEGHANLIIEKLEGQFLVNEGYVDEALKILLKNFNSQQRDFDYLKLLAKAAARAGEFQTAVGAYYKAHKLKPKHREGRRALFQAAFLSYRFQDYDGAARKFALFKDRYIRSGLSRDSYWHLAWIKYLKGDYEGAIHQFKQVMHQKKRRRRLWRRYSTEKINYWMAMSYFRLEKFSEAAAIFRELASNKLKNYYAFAASQRMQMIPKEIRAPASQFKVGAETVERSLQMRIAEIAKAKADEENESEESLALLKDVDEDEGVAEIDGADEEETRPVSFKDPRLKKNFERAQNFIRLGFYERAKWEYFEIERRTTNRDYLRLLMPAYEQIGSYHRSSYIGEIYFSSPRKNQGFVGAQDLWQQTYPQAFKPFVETHSQNFAVPSSFIWAIMRAESRYRPTIMSPVGARGLMQIMPNTGRQLARLLGQYTFKKSSLKEPQVNIRLGSRYLKRLLGKFKGSIPLAAASYNAGPHRVESWLSTFGSLEMDEFIEHIPFIETRNYVKKVVKNFGIYSELYTGKNMEMAWLSETVPVQILRDPARRESWD